MRSFFLRGDIFSLFFQLFQFDQITVETLYKGHLRDIEESGHCREAIVERLKEEWMYVMYGPSAKKQKNKIGPCREVTVKEEVDVSSEVRLNITWYYLNFFWNLVSLKLQQTVVSNTVILTEINEAMLLSIGGYCVCRDRYAVFRKLPNSRKQYLCMNSLLAEFSFQRHF